ncbi:MAG TPA: hypothetical protein DDW24_02795 [Blastocatellia bacterium]|nr:hypothetical protein [Blastocatellia bacterium]
MVAFDRDHSYGIFRTRDAVYVDRRGGAARDQFLVVDDVHGRLHDRARIHGRLCYFSSGFVFRILIGPCFRVHIQSIIVFLIVLAAVVYIAANFIRKHRPTKHVGECKQECGCGR